MKPIISQKWKINMWTLFLNSITFIRHIDGLCNFMSSFLTLNINEECEEDISDFVDILSKEISSQLSNIKHWTKSHEKLSRKFLTILIVFANYGSINRGKCLHRSL